MARYQPKDEPTPPDLRTLLIENLERHRGETDPRDGTSPTRQARLLEHLEAGDPVEVTGNQLRGVTPACLHRSSRRCECKRRCSAIHPLDAVRIDSDGTIEFLGEVGCVDHRPANWKTSSPVQSDFESA